MEGIFNSYIEIDKTVEDDYHDYYEYNYKRYKPKPKTEYIDINLNEFIPKEDKYKEREKIINNFYLKLKEKNY